MAYAPIPPTGEIYKAQKRRERKERERNSIDPVERYRLRENRLTDDLCVVTTALVRQAEINGKHYQQITKEK